MNLAHVLRRSEFLAGLFGLKLPEAGPVVLTQKRVYILPTRHGIVFAVALALMLVGSINYSLSLGYILTFLLAGMGLIAILHTFRNIAQLSVSAGRVEPVFAGDSARFHLHLDNPSPFERVGVELHCGGACTLCDVPRNRSEAAVLAVPAERRGWLPLPRVTIETRFPIGLLRAWSYVQPDVRALVYPRPDASSLPPQVIVPDVGDNVHAGTGTDDFAGLRPYQPSDSPRHIAWKSVARDGLLVTKVFAGRGTAELWLDWRDLPPELGVEERLSRLARWVLLADEAGVAYGLRIPARTLEPALGTSHRDECLKALALYDVREP